MELVRNMAQLAARRVLIMGLGTKDGGLGAALFALKHGAKVTITDRQSAHHLREPLRSLDGHQVRLKLGGHDPADFTEAQIVLRNPGIHRSHPLLRLASQNGAIVDSPIGLFAEAVSPRSALIGITGTKGKSYTTHLVQHILTCVGEDAVAAGNNCISPLRHLDARVLVLELSSWQLRELGLHEKSPHVACWLNFFPDHLDHYKTLGSYWDDKRMLTAHQGSDDWLILPWNDPRLRHLPTAARKSFYGATVDGSFEDGCCVRGGMVVVRRGGRDHAVAPVTALPPQQQVSHHFELVLASTACAVAHGIAPEAIAPALASFPGIPHRFEQLADWRGIQFINDSAATTPQSVTLALGAVARQPTVLIFGGGGRKGLSYDELAPLAARRAERIVLFANDEPSATLARLLPPGVNAVTVNDMEQAVRAGARALEGGGGTLLLSSGCSGAPFFPDLFVRGETFRRCVSALTMGVSR